MNGKEEPVEIEVEPEIQNILPFEDFYIDQFVDYLESDVNGNGHDGQIGNHQKHQLNSSSNHKPCNYQCTVCRETLGSGSELLKHVRTHTRMIGTQNERSLRKHKKCCICMRSFEHPTMLKVHEETQHYPPFRCRYCNSYHTALKYYKMHLNLHQMHHGQQQRKRSLSSSHVPEQSSMSSLHHRNNNHNKQCKKSGFKHFYTPPKLTTANLASLAVQTNHHGLPSSSLSPLRCKYCSKLFAKFTTLRKHEMLHKLNGTYNNQQNNNSNNLRTINSGVDVVEVNNITASEAAAQKSTALTLTPSLLSNLNKLANLKSSECNDGKKPAILININTNDTPQIETAKMKSQEMPLNSSSGLMISSVSSVDKNYFESIEKQRDAAATVFIQNGKKAVSLADLQCPICKKIVSQPFSLKVHLRTHTMEKPYSCPVCNKSFSQSCNLKTHMNIHNKHQYNQQNSGNNNSNGSPFTCSICNKTFLKASSLNTHMISHTAKLYCYACNINFDDDAVTYSQHMQVTHNVIMTKDLISRAKANLQRSESMSQQQQTPSMVEKDENEDERNEQQPRLMEVFQVQSSSATNGQIPKLKITIKKEPMVKQDAEEGHESDSSSSSSSSSNSSSSSSSSGSSSSSTTNNNNSNEEKNDNNNR